MSKLNIEMLEARERAIVAGYRLIERPCKATRQRYDTTYAEYWLLYLAVQAVSA